MKIREYNNETDYDGLQECAIALQNYERSLEPRIPRGQDIVDLYIPHLFERCRKNQGKIFVVDIGGTIAGYVLVLCKVVSEDIDDGGMEYGLITDLVVLEEFRNKGYGTMLLTTAENEAKANDVKWLRIGVLSSNLSANNLYLSKGFRPLSAQLEKSLF